MIKPDIILNIKNNLKYILIEMAILLNLNKIEIDLKITRFLRCCLKLQ